LGFGSADRGGGDRRVGVGLHVLGDNAAEVHAIQLVAAEDDHVFKIVVQEVDQVLANGVGRALVPGGVREGLFGGEDFHKAVGEVIELVRLGDVPVERSRVEVGEQVNLREGGIDAIGDGDVHQP